MVRRLVKQEDGFTLVEMMVTIMVMIVVMFALYNIFDMSIRVFSFGNNKVEAVENARIGLERMEREIRAAYPVDKPAGNDKVLTFWTANEIEFGNDLDGDGRITCSTNCERISYEVFEAPASSGKYALGRANTAAGNLQPTVENVNYKPATPTSPEEGLSFSYFRKDGTTEIAPGSGNESDIALVRVELKIKVKSGQQDGKQTLSTDVALRNRGNGVASAPSGGAAPQCDNGVDDDGDGLTDLSGGDPGCDSATDNDETDAAAVTPDTTIASGPSGTTAATTANFTFTSTVSGSTFECRLDSGSWGSCSSPKSYTGLSIGSHTFYVRATAAGNTDDSPASRNWTIGTPPPSNSNPKAVADSVTVKRGNSINIPVLSNDTDADNDPLTVQSFTQPGKGSVARSAANSNVLVYSVGNGTSNVGTHTFNYTISDGKGGTSSATVTVTVTK